MVRADDCVDAEPNKNGCEDVACDAESAGLRQARGRHVVNVWLALGLVAVTLRTSAKFTNLLSTDFSGRQTSEVIGDGLLQYLNKKLVPGFFQLCLELLPTRELQGRCGVVKAIPIGTV